ncbi:hypothetical protein B0T22DRAFT_71164 [Podospora appendiculata]|uniref:Uncharacterized protein n=1 Tax=Podospora appendiculata TaxID=314037 RepID=A0AAE0XJR5_9PEZI|nr:hypothetical protein B0T22DRAFT_71164 [Podospora appendiculata]
MYTIAGGGAWDACSMSIEPPRLLSSGRRRFHSYSSGSFPSCACFGRLLLVSSLLRPAFACIRFHFSCLGSSLYHKHSLHPRCRCSGNFHHTAARRRTVSRLVISFLLGSFSFLITPASAREYLVFSSHPTLLMRKFDGRDEANEASCETTDNLKNEGHIRGVFEQGYHHGGQVSVSLIGSERGGVGLL